MKKTSMQSRKPNLTEKNIERRLCRLARKRARKRRVLNAVAAAGRAATDLAPRLRPRQVEPDAAAPINGATTERSEWLVAVATIPKAFLAHAPAFLSEPASRAQLTWTCGVVEATSESQAYDAGFLAWETGRLGRPAPGEMLMNWYVARLK